MQDQRTAAAALLAALAWALALGAWLPREKAGAEGAPRWRAPRSFGGAVEVSGSLTRPGVRAGLAGSRAAQAIGRAGPRVTPWGPGLGARLREGDRVVLGADGLLRISRMPGERLLALGLPIDLETATPRDLEALPQVGPALAGRIVAWREARGGVGSARRLDEVAGIGPRTLARLLPLVRAGVCAPEKRRRRPDPSPAAKPARSGQPSATHDSRR